MSKRNPAAKTPTKAKASARPRGTAGSARTPESAKLTRAREIAGSELAPIFGGSIDPDDHLYRSLNEGPRDLPAYTHERQIELAFGLFLTDPLAKRIVEITKDYVVADGLTYEVEPSEAEQEAEKAAQAERGRVEAERKAAAQAADLAKQVALAGVPAAPPRAAEAVAGDDDEGDDEDGEETDAPGAAPSTDPTSTLSSDEPTCEELTAVLERHWNDPDNNWPLKQSDRAIGLSVWGEQFYPVFVRESDGHVKLGRLDPRRIKAVITDPDNEERVVSVVTRALIAEQERVYRVVHVQEAGEGGEGGDGGSGADSTRDGYLVGARPGETCPVTGRAYTGSCFYFAVNRVQGAKRGHSDLFSLIDWIDAYSTLLFDGIDSASLKGSFVWDVTLNGADDTAIAEFKKKNAKPPKKGAVRIHNENVTWAAVTPDLKALDHAEFARLYRVHILGGAGLPEHWYGEGDSATRATASEMSAPVLRRLKARQSYFCALVEEVLRYAVDCAILAGEIRGTPETKNRVKVHAPEFEAGDVAKGAGALAQGTSALAVAEDRKWISRDTARKGFAAIADHLGVKVDAEAEKAAAEAQDEAQAESDAANAPAAPEALEAAGARGIVPPMGSTGGAAASDRAAEAMVADLVAQTVQDELARDRERVRAKKAAAQAARPALPKTMRIEVTG